MELHETDGVTTLTWRLAFRDKAGRDHMTRFDGQQDSLDEMENILRSLLDPTAPDRTHAHAGGLNRSAQHFLIRVDSRRLRWRVGIGG